MVTSVPGLARARAGTELGSTTAPKRMSTPSTVDSRTASVSSLPTSRLDGGVSRRVESSVSGCGDVSEAGLPASCKGVSAPALTMARSHRWQ